MNYNKIFSKNIMTFKSISVNNGRKVGVKQFSLNALLIQNHQLIIDLIRII